MISRIRKAQRGEAGFTLVEMLVAMVVFSVVMSIAMATVMASRRSVQQTKQLDDANEEARLALNRIARELRQAKEINNFVLYTTGAYGTAGYGKEITFGVDFNGDGTIDPNAVDAELLTYRYVPDATGNGQILLEANDAAGNPVSQPVLAGHVSDFHFELYSSLWVCDTNGDGRTTWKELDTNIAAACPHPDNNNTLDANELRSIDSVVIDFTVFEGSHRQDYRTQVNLRNVGVSRTSGN